MFRAAITLISHNLKQWHNVQCTTRSALRLRGHHHRHRVERAARRPLRSIPPHKRNDYVARVDTLYVRVVGLGRLVARRSSCRFSRFGLRFL